MRSLNSKGGGLNEYYCKNWGCETSRQVYWNPESSWDYIKVTANYTLLDWYRGRVQWDWGHPLRISFTEQGKRATNWVRGYDWGLRLYIDGYNDGLIFTIKLRIETPSVLLGPNSALNPPHPPPNPPRPSPQTKPELAAETITPTIDPLTSHGGLKVIPTLPLQSDLGASTLLDMLTNAFRVLNATNPEITKRCWLRYHIAPLIMKVLHMSVLLIFL